MPVVDYHRGYAKESLLFNVLATDSEHWRHNSFFKPSALLQIKHIFKSLDHSTKKPKVMTKITSKSTW